MPGDINSSNEANSESKKDPTTTFVIEPIVTYLDDPDNSAENYDEWVINEKFAFDYSLYFDDVHNVIDSSSLHMPLLRQ